MEIRRGNWERKIHTSSDSPVYARGWAQPGQFQHFFFFPCLPPSSSSLTLVHVASGGPTFHWTLSSLFPIHTPTTWGTRSMCVCVCVWTPCQKSPTDLGLVKPWMNGWVENGAEEEEEGRMIGVGGLRNSSVSDAHTRSPGLNWASRDKPALSLIWKKKRGAKRRDSLTERRQFLSPNHPLFKPLSLSLPLYVSTYLSLFLPALFFGLSGYC